MRYRLYAHWGLTPTQIARVIAFCSLTFGLGGMVLAGTILFIEPGAVPFLGERVPHWAMYAVGALLWGIDIGYVAASHVVPRFRLFGYRVELPGWRMALVQVLLATLDVAVTAAIFYALLPPAHGLNYLRFVGVYLASYSAGLLADVAGRHRRVRRRDAAGAGTLSAGAAHRRRDPGVPALLLHHPAVHRRQPVRGQRDDAARRASVLRGGIAPIGRISEPDFAVAVGAGSVALCGFLLLALGVLEQRPDYSWIDAGLSPRWRRRRASSCPR